MISKFKRSVSKIRESLSAREVEAVKAGNSFLVWYSGGHFVSYDKWQEKFELRDRRKRIVSVHRTLSAAIAAAPLTVAPETGVMHDD